jgi:hypothetical protein
MAVTIYRSSDGSAPGAYSNTVSSLITILDACLVNGYGAKVAAGWTKAFSGTNKAAYRNSTTAPSTGFYFRVDDTSTSESRVVGYESMSDVDTGADAFPTNTQVSGGMYLQKNATTTTWMVIADSRAFYFFYKYAGAAKWWGFYFGDIVSRVASDPYCCAIIGRSAAGTSGNSEDFPRGSVSPITSSNGHYIARNYNGTVKSVNFSKLTWLNGTYLGLGGFVYPNPSDGNFIMDRCLVCDDMSTANLRGYMPGLWNPLHYDPASDADTFSGNGDLAGRSYLIVANVNTSSAGKSVIETSDTWRS